MGKNLPMKNSIKNDYEDVYKINVKVKEFLNYVTKSSHLYIQEFLKINDLM